MSKPDTQWGGARKGAGRPKKPPTERMKAVTFSLPMQLVERIEEVAKETGINKSALVTSILKRSKALQE